MARALCSEVRKRRNHQTGKWKAAISTTEKTKFPVVHWERGCGSQRGKRLGLDPEVDSDGEPLTFFFFLFCYS